MICVESPTQVEGWAATTKSFDGPCAVDRLIEEVEENRDSEREDEPEDSHFLSPLAANIGHPELFMGGGGAQ